MSAAAGAGAIPAAGQGERRVAARGVVWGGVESAASAAVGLVLTPFVVRATGIEGLGLWGASWSLAHTAALFDLGAGASYARFAARAIARDDADELNDSVAVGAGIHLTTALVIGAGALLALPLILSRMAPAAATHAAAVPVVTLTLATVLLRSGFSAWRGVVAGAQRTDLLGRIGAVAALAEGALGAAALLAGLGLVGMAAASLVSAAGITLAEARVAARLCPRLRFRPFRAPRERYQEVVGFGLRLQATRAFEVIGAQAPRLVLAAGPGLAAAGVYDLGARLAGLTPLAAALPLRVILPLAGHLDARGDRERLEALARRATHYVALLALAPLALVLLDAPALLTLWVGGAPAPGAATCARLLAASLAVGLVASPLRLVIRACGHAGLEAAAAATGTVVLVLGALFVARPFGASGVAAAALAGSLSAAVALATRAAIGRVTAARPWRTLAAALPAAAAGLTAVAAGGLAALVVTDPAPADRAAAIVHLARTLPFAALAFAALAGATGALGLADLALVREAAGRAGDEVRA